MNKAFGNRLNRIGAEEVTEQPPMIKKMKTSNLNNHPTKDDDKGKPFFGVQNSKTQPFFSNQAFQKPLAPEPEDDLKWDQLKIVPLAQTKTTKTMAEGRQSPKLIPIDLTFAKKKPQFVPASEEKPGIGKKQLIEYQRDVASHLISRSKEYELKEFPRDRHDFYRKCCRCIEEMVRCHRLRPETQLLSAYLLNVVVSKVQKGDLVEYFIPCVLIASKVEEYYPPLIFELQRQLKLSGLLTSYAGFERINQDSIRVFELKVLDLVSFKVICPPLLDLGHMVINDLGLESAISTAQMRSTLLKLLRAPNLFTKNMATVVTACIELSADLENGYLATNKHELTELVSEYLFKEFGLIVLREEVVGLCTTFSKLSKNTSNFF